MELRIKRAPQIDIEITVPGDKSISHRAVIIAALSNGVCTLRGFLPSEDCMHTVNAMRALGVKIEQSEPDTLLVHGKRRVLAPPKKQIDCGNSGTTMRLLAGNSLPAADCERAGQKCVAPGGSICQGQNHCPGALNHAKSY